MCNCIYLSLAIYIEVMITTGCSGRRQCQKLSSASASVHHSAARRGASALPQVNLEVCLDASVSDNWVLRRMIGLTVSFDLNRGSAVSRWVTEFPVTSAFLLCIVN